MTVDSDKEGATQIASATAASKLFIQYTLIMLMSNRA